MSDVEIEHAVIVDRPPEEVFAYVTDPARAPEWREGLLEARRVTEGPMRAGSVIEEDVELLGRRLTSRVEVAEVDPGRERTLLVRLGPLPIRLRERYEALGDRTRFTVTGSAEVGGARRLAARAALGAVRRRLEREMAAVKRVLEGEPPGSA